MAGLGVVRLSFKLATIFLRVARYRVELAILHVTDSCWHKNQTHKCSNIFRSDGGPVGVPDRDLEDNFNTLVTGMIQVSEAGKSLWLAHDICRHSFGPGRPS